jgi:cell division protein FtsB
MMKRNPSNSDIKKDNTKAKQENSSADKERAYAEARARIFGNLVENGVYFYNINSTTIEETELKKQGFSKC